MHVTAEQAQHAIAVARAKATELGTRMCIAVVDSGANLKAFMRMDDAWVGSTDIAIKKARTACFFGMPTGLIGQLSQPEGPLFGIEHSNEGLITFPGGLPIVTKDGVLIGAIGVSGSSGRERSCCDHGGSRSDRGFGSPRPSVAYLANRCLLDWCGNASAMIFTEGTRLFRKTIMRFRSAHLVNALRYAPWPRRARCSPQQSALPGAGPLRS
jgi:uncharacterized protein GlcG (DUF336 family)